MSVGQVQFYKSTVKLALGGTSTLADMPTYAGSAFGMPSNWSLPPVVGNYGQWTYGDGLLQPGLDVQMCVRDVANECMTQAFWDAFLVRSNDASHDTSIIDDASLVGAVFFDGQDAWALSGVKGNGFTLSAAKSSDIQIAASYVATSAVRMLAASNPSPPTWDDSNQLRFNKVTVDIILQTGASMSNPLSTYAVTDSDFTQQTIIVCGTWGFTLSHSSNLNPNMSLDGTQFPTEWNAGMATGSLQLNIQANQAAVLLKALEDAGSAYLGSIPAGWHPTPVAVRITITGGGSPARVWKAYIPNCLVMNPNDRNNRPPRIMRGLTFVCRAEAPHLLPVRVVSTNF